MGTAMPAKAAQARRSMVSTSAVPLANSVCVDWQPPLHRTHACVGHHHHCTAESTRARGSSYRALSRLTATRRPHAGTGPTAANPSWLSLSCPRPHNDQSPLCSWGMPLQHGELRRTRVDGHRLLDSWQGESHSVCSGGAAPTFRGGCTPVAAVCCQQPGPIVAVAA